MILGNSQFFCGFIFTTISWDENSWDKNGKFRSFSATRELAVQVDALIDPRDRIRIHKYGFAFYQDNHHTSNPDCIKILEKANK